MAAWPLADQLDGRGLAKHCSGYYVLATLAVLVVELGSAWGHGTGLVAAREGR